VTQWNSLHAKKNWSRNRDAINAENTKRQLDFTQSLRTLAGELSDQTGALLHLRVTEKLMLSKRIEKELIATFGALSTANASDQKDYGKTPDAKLDINAILKTEGMVDIDERVRALKEILSMPTVADLKYVSPDVLKQAAATLSAINDSAGKMVEEATAVYKDLEARNNPQLDDLMNQYLQFARKTEDFQAKIATHQTLLSSKVVEKAPEKKSGAKRK
jgi:hypothetical protein